VDFEALALEFHQGERLKSARERQRVTMRPAR